MKDYFGIGPGTELASERFKFRSEFPKVVYLSIVTDGILPILSDHWLMPSRREVNDGKTAVSEPDEAVRVKPLAIGPAIGNGIRHFSKVYRRNRFPIQIKYTRYPTHFFASQESKINVSI
jgi:hypothetical protein